MVEKTEASGTLRIEAQAKINLALDVTGRRADGYHFVRMIMQSIDRSDSLVLRKMDEPGVFLEKQDVRIHEDLQDQEADRNNNRKNNRDHYREKYREKDRGKDRKKEIQNEIKEGREDREELKNPSINPDGSALLPNDGNNLAVKGAKCLLSEFCPEAGVRISLTKRIPIAAGLAGGSTDAAAAMLGVNRLFSLGLSLDELAIRAEKIGADVPFCLYKGTMLAEGIGEILTPLPPMPDCFLLLAKPPVSISTPEVYHRYDRLSSVRHPDIPKLQRALEAADLEEIARGLGNVLSEVTESSYPEVARIRASLIRNGALGALMSGSGPSVFGIFSEKEKAALAAEKLRGEGLCREIFLTRPFRRDKTFDSM